MRPVRAIYLGVLAATAAVYLVMVLWSLPYIAAQAGGLMPLDLRPAGYDLAAAQAFLQALSEEGRVFYLTVQHRLDAAYPPLMGMTLGLSFWFLTARWLRAPRLALLALCAVITGFDWLENLRVAGLLQMDPAALDARVVGAASTASVVKAGASTVAFTLLLGLLALRGWEKLKRKRNV